MKNIHIRWAYVYWGSVYARNDVSQPLSKREEMVIRLDNVENNKSENRKGHVYVIFQSSIIPLLPIARRRRMSSASHSDVRVTNACAHIIGVVSHFPREKKKRTVVYLSFSLSLFTPVSFFLYGCRGSYGSIGVQFPFASSSRPNCIATPIGRQPAKACIFHDEISWYTSSWICFKISMICNNIKKIFIFCLKWK